jgi:hypothetical protein
VEPTIKPKDSGGGKAQKGVVDEDVVFLFERSHMVEGESSTTATPSTTTRPHFQSLLEEVINADYSNGSPIALSELLVRSRIRLLTLTLDWWDCIFWNINCTLDGIDARMSDDHVVSHELSQWRRLWCSWRGLLTEFEKIL